MRFFIDDLEVLFPFDYIYPEQLQYMRSLKQSLGKGHSLLEMPTGTGKTVTLLSLLLSYQHKYPEVGKIVYCTRTVHEMNKVLSELENLTLFREEIIRADQIAFSQKYPDVTRITIELLNQVGLQAKQLAQEQREEEQEIKQQMNRSIDADDDDHGMDRFSRRKQSNPLIPSSMHSNSTNTTTTTTTSTTTTTTTTKPKRKNPFQRMYTEVKSTDNNNHHTDIISIKRQGMDDPIPLEIDQTNTTIPSTSISTTTTSPQTLLALSSLTQQQDIKLEPGQVTFDFNIIDDPNTIIKSEDGSLSTFNRNKKQQQQQRPQQSLNTGPGLRSYIVQRTSELLIAQHGIDKDLAYHAVNLLRSPSILGLCLSARTNMCIHPTIGRFQHREKVDTLCRSKTANYVREQVLERLIRTSQQDITNMNTTTMDDIDTAPTNMGSVDNTYPIDDTIPPPLIPMGDDDSSPISTNTNTTTNTTTNTSSPSTSSSSSSPCGSNQNCTNCPASSSSSSPNSPSTSMNDSTTSMNDSTTTTTTTTTTSIRSTNGGTSINADVEDIVNYGLCPWYEGYLSVTNNRSYGFSNLSNSNTPIQGQAYTDSVHINVQNNSTTSLSQSLPTDGIFDINSLVTLGTQMTACPYYLARYLLSHANVVVYNYHYMLDPKVNAVVDNHLEPESIVVFDEAHNIDNICIEALSITITKHDVFDAIRALQTLHILVHQTEQENQQKLRDEYNSILTEIQSQQRRSSSTSSTSLSSSAVRNDELIELIASPVVLPPELIQQAIPGSIRKARGFLLFLQSFVQFLRTQLLMTSARELQTNAFLEMYKQTLSVHDITACKFAYDRLSMLLTTLNVTDFEAFVTLIKIASFITLVANYEAGFVILYEPVDDLGIADPRIQLTCVDSSIAIQPVFNKYASVVITSGTLSPLDMYPKMLGFTPYISQQFTMSLNRNVVVPLIITKSNDQYPISTSYAFRDDDNIVTHYGNLIIQLAKQIPDGIVAFFPSYAYMENILLSWNEAKPDPKTGQLKETIISQLLRYKLIFVETKEIEETSIALAAYKKSCDNGRGAIFFSIARGKVSEGIDFNGHYGRAVVMIGVPYQYTRSRTLLARLEFLRSVLGIQEADYLNFDALRQTSQCLGRIVRSKKDYGLMILADTRYNRQDIRMKLPRWIQNFIKTGESTSLSIDAGIMQVKNFLRDMSIPHDIKYDYGTVLLNEEQAVGHLSKLE